MKKAQAARYGLFEEFLSLNSVSKKRQPTNSCNCNETEIERLHESPIFPELHKACTAGCVTWNFAGFTIFLLVRRMTPSNMDEAEDRVVLLGVTVLIARR